MAFTQRVFSGIQPSGDLHLGNYLGAIRRFVPLQDQYDCIYCVVDMHAITVWQEPNDLRRATREVAAAYVAAGIDPKKAIVFNQSQVMQHAELAWVFNCIARIGWMYRMTQFKDKAGKNSENVSLGLLAYPSLMAADILLYKATHVPVGDDQKQHLELTRDIAQKFNNDYSASIKEQGLDPEFFPTTEPMIAGPATRIMSLRDGTKKMSKSDPSDQSRISLLDDADGIAKKIKRATTDPEPLPSEVEGLKGRAEADNLVGIYAALSDKSKAEVLAQFGGQGWGVFKPALAELAVSVLGPVSGEMKRLVNDPATIDGILRDGADRARAIAEDTMREVRNIVGFIR
ncbi:tryptophan--tRNA ligase [Paradevosia shaoguanensis]|uniref:Tryptophan--tRNA ligase n=1 Tax=Paradevosia shaoguanensis TaxID=1335043 RepID=A0AA41UHL6_9HYPH|nr:tryptophan--tRNA ligase [Paradevosia shaoguanensis]MCF1743973.1 tryptophan--tRNA ligase [Paradevosia shaoguanensis]MCI0128456.1 tryptophan--tRNA ligase [Paradevosia shaoguanensis]